MKGMTCLTTALYYHNTIKLQSYLSKQWPVTKKSNTSSSATYSRGQNKAAKEHDQ